MSIVSSNYAAPAQPLPMALANLGSTSATASSYIDNTANGIVLLPGSVSVTNGSTAVSMASISGTVTVTNGSTSVTTSLTGYTGTGTVTVTNASATVTGSSTSFLTQLSVGQMITFGGGTATGTYVIGSITNNTSLTLTTNYTGTGTSGASFTYLPLSIGQLISFSSQPGVNYTISSITNTTLTLTGFYSGATSSSATLYTNGGTYFNSTLYVNQVVQFAGSLGTTYTIASIASAYSLSLTTTYSGTTSNSLSMYSFLNEFEDIFVQVKATTNTTPVAPSIINVYATGTSDGGLTYGEEVTGVSAPVTLTSPPNARLIGTMNVGTSAATAPGGSTTVYATNGYSVLSSATAFTAAVGETITLASQAGVPYMVLAIGSSVTGSGTVATTSGSSTVTGTSTSFLTQFVPGQAVTFSGGTTPPTGTYVIATITSNTSLTLTTNANNSGSGSVTLTGNPTLTMTSPYTGATSTGTTLTGYVSKFSSPFSVASAFSGSLPDHIVIIVENRSGVALLTSAFDSLTNVNVTNGSATVTTATSSFLQLTVGQVISFASQPGVPYTISAIGSGTSLTLASNYTGTTSTTTSLYLETPAFGHTWQGIKRQVA